MNSFSWKWAVAFTCILLTACASRGARSVSIDSPPTDWENPIDGVVVSSVAEAVKLVPFTVYPPRKLGNPTKILVSAPGVQPEMRVVAFLFDTPDYGRVVVTEHIPDVPPEQYDEANQSLVALNGEPNVHGSAEIVSIRGGKNALVTTSEDGSESTIFWLEGGVEFVVKGPSIDRENILQVVDDV